MRTEKEELQYKIAKTERKLERLKRQLKEFVLPKRWEDLEKIGGFFILHDSEIERMGVTELDEVHKNTFATREQAEASIALAQLSQLREVYRQGWKPDWNDYNKIKYCIDHRINGLGGYETGSFLNFLSFQSPEIRDEFLKNFIDLIVKAKPLMS